MTILIVGAAGNLGSHLTKHLLGGPHSLRLLTHTSALPVEVANDPRISKINADLNDPLSLVNACSSVDCVVYAAGVLFRPRPESFLHITNTKYVQNIVDAALSTGVRKFVLISFPHVEGETSPEVPALGQLDAHSTTLHSQTRLAAEQYLFRACEGKAMKPLVLRAGVVYGRDVKLIEAARSLMRMRLFAIWRTPTWVHLLALPDFLRIVEIGIEKTDLCGIFNVCDDKPMLLQDFLDEIAAHWGFKAPLRLPAFVFYWTAILCETFATIFHTNTPLTRDIVTMGMTSVVADTSRMKNEISATLLFPTLKQGLSII
jgi:nucleoside-diphosphate-sugar epimerase